MIPIETKLLWTCPWVQSADLKSAILKSLILTANYANSHKLIGENLCNLWLENFLEAESKIQ